MEEQGNGVPTINGTEVNIGNNGVNTVNTSGGTTENAGGIGANAGGVTGTNTTLGNGTYPGGTTTGTTDGWKQAGLPVKVGFWSKFKEVLFKEIKVELTPKQQKVEDEINAFLFQEITFGKKKKTAK